MPRKTGITESFRPPAVAADLDDVVTALETNTAAVTTGLEEVDVTGRRILLGHEVHLWNEEAPGAEEG